MQKNAIFHAMQCDMPGCNHKANNGYSLYEKTESISLCANCEKEMFELLMKEKVPPAIANRFKKMQKIEKENV